MQGLSASPEGFPEDRRGLRTPTRSSENGCIGVALQRTAAKGKVQVSHCRRNVPDVSSSAFPGSFEQRWSMLHSTFLRRRSDLQGQQIRTQEVKHGCFGRIAGKSVLCSPQPSSVRRKTILFTP